MARTLRWFVPVTIAVLVLLVTGCWIPEDFDVAVKIDKDGNYTFTYDGTLAFAPALAAAKQKGLSERDEAQLRKKAQEMKQESDFKEVRYLGEGRYKVLVQKTGNAKEPYFFLSRELNIFTIQPLKDGSVQISAVRPGKADIQQLNMIGAKMAGTLKVSVARGVKVLKHNAQSEPKFFGLLGGYKWEIKSPDANPMIIVKPAL